jgi:hypothetical protein
MSRGPPTYENGHNITLNMKWLKENRQAVAMAWRVLQYNQILDKVFCDISRVLWKCLQYLKILFTYSKNSEYLMLFWSTLVGER